jgi:diaminohydroxyphosphoribosylaminopyrimidine deaminase/5-amino-6-(5-phosphoribosylamino)uracil reductase
LATAGVAHVYLEGGPGLAGAFVQAGLVDRVIAYYAGRLIGSGPPALEAPAITTLANAPHLAITDVAVLGADVRLTATCAPSKQE